MLERPVELTEESLTPDELKYVETPQMWLGFTPAKEEATLKLTSVDFLKLAEQAKAIKSKDRKKAFLRTKRRQILSSSFYRKDKSLPPVCLICANPDARYVKDCGILVWLPHFPDFFAFHEFCLLMAPETFCTSSPSTLEKNMFKISLSSVHQAFKRVILSKYNPDCSYCGFRGAFSGCWMKRCMSAYHLPCAMRLKCHISYTDNSVICPTHIDRTREKQKEILRKIFPNGFSRKTDQRLMDEESCVFKCVFCKGRVHFKAQLPWLGYNVVTNCEDKAACYHYACMQDYVRGCEYDARCQVCHILNRVTKFHEQIAMQGIYVNDSDDDDEDEPSRANINTYSSDSVEFLSSCDEFLRCFDTHDAYYKRDEILLNGKFKRCRVGSGDNTLGEAGNAILNKSLELLADNHSSPKKSDEQSSKTVVVEERKEIKDVRKEDKSSIVTVTKATLIAAKSEIHVSPMKGRAPTMGIHNIIQSQSPSMASNDSDSEYVQDDIHSGPSSDSQEVMAEDISDADVITIEHNEVETKKVETETDDIIILSTVEKPTPKKRSSSDELNLSDVSSGIRELSSPLKEKIHGKVSEGKIHEKVSQGIIQGEASQGKIQGEASQGKIQGEASKEKIHKEASREKIHIEASREKIHVEASIKKIRVEASREKIHVEASKEKIPVEAASKERIPVTAAKERNPVTASEEKISVEPFKGKIPEEPSKEKIPVEPFREKIPVETSKGKIPVEASREKNPVEPFREKIPVETSKGKIPVEASREKNPVEPFREKILVETFKGKIPAEASKEKIPVEPFKGKIPVEASKGNIPVEASKGKILVEAFKEKITVEAFKGKIPVEAFKGKIPTEAFKGKIPVEAFKGKIPVEPSKGKIPVDPSREKIHVEPSREKIPVEPSKGKIPVEASREKIPITASREKIPVEPSKGKIPVAAYKEKIHVEASKEKINVEASKSKASEDGQATEVCTAGSRTSIKKITSKVLRESISSEESDDEFGKMELLPMREELANLTVANEEEVQSVVAQVRIVKIIDSPKPEISRSKLDGTDRISDVTACKDSISDENMEVDSDDTERFFTERPKRRTYAARKAEGDHLVERKSVSSPTKCEANEKPGTQLDVKKPTVKQSELKLLDMRELALKQLKEGKEREARLAETKQFNGLVSTSEPSTKTPFMFFHRIKYLILKCVDICTKDFQHIMSNAEKERLIRAYECTRGRCTKLMVLKGYNRNILTPVNIAVPNVKKAILTSEAVMNLYLRLFQIFARIEEHCKILKQFDTTPSDFSEVDHALRLLEHSFMNFINES